jgi:hypothetical protein
LRYRAQDINGDYTWGQPNEFLVNTPDAVAQAVKTRLLLKQPEWFLDVTAGTPYATLILGVGTKATYDGAIREVILDTIGVTEITAYASQLNPVTRALSIQATINTVYGAPDPIAVTL